VLTVGLLDVHKIVSADNWTATLVARLQVVTNHCNLNLSLNGIIIYKSEFNFGKHPKNLFFFADVTFHPAPTHECTNLVSIIALQYPLHREMARLALREKSQKPTGNFRKGSLPTPTWSNHTRMTSNTRNVLGVARLIWCCALTKNQTRYRTDTGRVRDHRARGQPTLPPSSHTRRARQAHAFHRPSHGQDGIRTRWSKRLLTLAKLSSHKERRVCRWKSHTYGITSRKPNGGGGLG